MIVTLLLLLARASAAAPAVEGALSAELTRGMAQLRLPDSPPPYLIQYDVLDGEVASVFAELGATVSDSRERYRNLRVDVRVGSYTRDSSDFFAFGHSGGVSSRRLPVDDDPVALQREIWLATDECYKAAVEQLARKEAVLASDPSPRPAAYQELRPPSVSFDDSGPAPAPADGDRVRHLAERLSGELRGFSAIEVGQAVARDWQGRRLVLTSEGTRQWRPTGYTVVRVEGTVRLPDGSELTDSRSWVARTPAELPPEEEMVAEVHALGEILQALPTAPVESDYLGPVLFEGLAATELFSQLLAAEIVGTPPPLEDDASMLRAPGTPTARLGRRLLPTGWSVVDDARPQPGAMGTYAYDFEGVAPRPVELVKDGVLRDMLMSRIPNKDLAASTGHGRSLGNDRRAAMPANVRVTPDREVSARRLEKLGTHLAADTGRPYFLVVRALQPPALQGSTDISFSGEDPLPGLTTPYEVYRVYADGRRELVRAGSFAGVDRRSLRDIVGAAEGPGLANLLDGPAGPGRFHIGNTGGLPVSWDVPSVLVSEMELRSGGGGGEPRVLTIPTVPRP